MTLHGVVIAAAALATLPAEAAEERWVLSTSDTRIGLEVAEGVVLVRKLESSGISHNWAGDGMTVPLMATVWVADELQQVRWAFVDASLTEDGSMLTLTFHSERPRMVLKSVWRARPGPGPVEHWLALENRSDTRITVSHQDSLSLEGLTPGADSAVWWIRRGGSNASTQGGTYVEPLTPQLDLNLESNCDDGASPVPWLAVQCGDAHGLYVGWEFSGLGRVAARAGEDGATLNLAIGLMPDFKTDVAPGEVFEVPPAFAGCYSGDIDAGAYSLHQWILAYLRPPVSEGIPDPILAYNLYLDAGGTRAREADVVRSAEFCREIGFEAFMPDAMWFPACGDWRWDPNRFPKGANPVADYVHASGMRFALWCAWTNGGVSEDPGALSVRGPAGHPDWFDSDFAADWQPAAFSGGRVCLACPEAREWATAKTQWLVSHHKLDYLKHDCGPIVTHCSKTTHRHGYGVDTSYWATMGYYHVQEQLRKAFPDILLENCSGGGHIKDFGIIQHTHYTVTTDTLSNLPDRQSIYDSTFAFPPVLLQAYTYERFYQVPGDEPGSYLWRSAMMGAWQIDPTNTRIWTEDEAASARRDAQIYKGWVRPMLKDAKVHHILPRPDGIHWDGMFYWSPSFKRGTLYIFRPDAQDESMGVRLKGLDDSRTYWVWSEDGSVKAGVHTGADLMGVGLSVVLPTRFSCDLAYVRDAALGKPSGLEPPGAFRLGEVRPESDAFQASAEVTWTASANAHSYRITVARDAEFKEVLADKRVIGQSARFSNLPPDTLLFWAAEAIGWGGRQPHEGACGSFTTSPLAELPGVRFVSDMPWERATAGANNTVHRDTNYSGLKIAIGGRVFPKGVWTHSFDDATPADLAVGIAGAGFGRFVADAGVEDSAGGGSLQFQVLLDNALAAESPVMKHGDIHHFDVDLSGVAEITLRVMNGGDGYTCDHAAWGMARFISAGVSDPLQE